MKLCMTIMSLESISYLYFLSPAINTGNKCDLGTLKVGVVIMPPNEGSTNCVC
jgi:hypothetical protein